MKIKDVMKTELLVLRPDHLLRDAINYFMNEKLEIIPIINNRGAIIGVIEKDNMLDLLINSISPLIHIDKVMNINFKTVVADDIVTKFSNEKQALMVVDHKNRLVGMLTYTNLLKTLIEIQKEEKEELKEILNCTNHGFLVTDIDGYITRYNEASIRILEMKDKTLIGKNINDVFPQAALIEVIGKGKNIHIEKILFNEKTLICDRIVLYSNNVIVGAVVVFKDQSELQSVIAELSTVQKLTKKLDAIIESSYDGIYITDGHANTLIINKSYERITGVKREEMLGKNMVELVEAEYVSKSVTIEVLKSKRTTTLCQKFKANKKALVTATPIFDEKGEISLVVTNVRDVTELAKLNKQVQKNKELAEKYYSEIKEMRLQLLSDVDVIATDDKMLEIMRIANRVAKVDATVLILGETGVGKEEVAKYIHRNSNRKENQFIKVNCGAIPENLIESEFFGYEKGAFTGAAKEGKRGFFEIANGGTVFLDEIGELPLKMQVKLLRVLQEQEFNRVGGVQSIKIDIRVLAATNKDLKEMVRMNNFREDLYYRLNVIPLTIPPLRERKKDILPLIECFLSQLNKKYNWNKSFDKETLNQLHEYDWPGNVRELKNIVERVFVMSNESEIEVEDLPIAICENKKFNILDSNNIMPLKDAVAKVEIELIKQAFEKYKNVRDASKILGIDASTFVRKRKKYIKNELF